MHSLAPLTKKTYLFLLFLATVSNILHSQTASTSLRDSITDQISYQGIRLEPGDVINFHGGIFAKFPFLKRGYGHTALYLGRDEQTGQPIFLDFSTDKSSPEIDLTVVEGALKPGTDRPFYGRIMKEDEFLIWNRKYGHPSFDVFRLRERASLSKQLLVEEAKAIADKEWWGPFDELCSSAVAKALSKSTGMEIGVKYPDQFASDPAFQRHPELIGRTINLCRALKGRQEEMQAQLGKELDQARVAVGQAENVLEQAEQALRRAQEGRDTITERKAQVVVNEAREAVEKWKRVVTLAQRRFDEFGKALRECDGE